MSGTASHIAPTTPRDSHGYPIYEFDHEAVCPHCGGKDLRHVGTWKWGAHRQQGLCAACVQWVVWVRVGFTWSVLDETFVRTPEHSTALKKYRAAKAALEAAALVA